MEVRPFNHSGFDQWLQEKKIMGCRCLNCAEVYLPPRPMCTRCYGSQMEWVAFSGEGRLSAYTLIHIGLPTMIAEGYSRERPYCSGVVRLVEGPSISAQILGDPGADEQHFQVGMPVQAVFVEHGGQNGGQISLAFQAKDSG